jgi:hypothetical protein
MKNIILIAVLAWVILPSCSPTRVIVEKNQYQDFKMSNYSSFDFAQIDTPNDSLVPYEEIVGILKEKIALGLEERGFVRDSSNPELRVNLGVVVEDKVQTRTSNVTTDPFTYAGERKYYWERREIPVNSYRKGSLTVHFVNNSGDVLVWAGTISEVVPKKREKQLTTMQTVVNKVFKHLDENNK